MDVKAELRGSTVRSVLLILYNGDAGTVHRMRQPIALRCHQHHGVERSRSGLETNGTSMLLRVQLLLVKLRADETWAYLICPFRQYAQLRSQRTLRITHTKRHSVSRVSRFARGLL